MFGFFKRKAKFPEIAKYKKGDYVNFRYRDDLFFGYIFEASLTNESKVVYTIQLAGQCPSFIKNYKEEDIIGLKTN